MKIFYWLSSNLISFLLLDDVKAILLPIILYYFLQPCLQKIFILISAANSSASTVYAIPFSHISVIKFSKLKRVVFPSASRTEVAKSMCGMPVAPRAYATQQLHTSGSIRMGPIGFWGPINLLEVECGTH